MLRNIFKVIELGVRWLTFVVALAFLIWEFIRVLWYVIDEWGFFHVFVDGAALHKVGEFAIIIPFLIFVHWNGIWKATSLEEYVRNVRWVIWLGGILNFVAAFDLFGRVDWAWWTIPLMIFSLVLPLLLMRWAKKKAKWRGRILATFLAVLFLCHYALSYFFSGYFIAPLPASHPSAADSEHGRWQQDLHYLATELPRLHKNAFHTIDSQKFDEEVAKLDSSIPDLSTDEIIVGLKRLVSMVGDGHTQFDWLDLAGGRKVPLELYWLSDGLFVIGAGEDCREALGARVIGIGSFTADSAFETVCTLIPHETGGYLIDESPELLIATDKLHGLGIIDNSVSAKYAFEKKNEDTITCDLIGRTIQGSHNLHYLPNEIPLYRTRSDEEYWSDYFKEINTLYLKYNSFDNPISFPRYSDKFWQMVDDSSVEYLIIDFRDNAGGATICFDRFFGYLLEHDNINRTNHLYVLVNRGSFSSAKYYAVTMRRETIAILVGEEMGGAPNSYGEVRTFRLPNSGVRVSYSTRYHRLWPDSLPPFKVDIPIIPSSDEYFAGKDPVLDSVIQLIKLDIR
jgi:hypothetical protein